MINEASGSNKYVEEPGLFEYSKIFWDKRWPIATSLFITSIFAIVISLILPKSYQASVVLMPPTQNSTAGLLSTLSSLPLGGLIPQTTDETMSFIAILKSRTVMEDVVNQFDLITRYEVDNIEEAVRALSNNATFTIEDEGTIRISADASTSWFHPDDEEEVAKTLSADMANYFVQQLDVLGKGLKSQEASFRRRFIEKRYNQNVKDLMEAEDSLKVFQQRHKTIALPEQTRAAIETAAIVKGQILADEVQLGVMTNTLSSDHPELERVKKEIVELKYQFRLMEYGSGNSAADTKNLFPVFSKVPELGVRLMRLQRNVEIQNTLFVFLTQQFEEAKIQEAKDTPTIQILDKAVAPIRKHRPRRMLMVVSLFLVTFLVNIIYIVAKTNQRVITPR